MRVRILAGVVGLGCTGLSVLGLTTPVSGQVMERDNIAADCEDASMNTARGGGSNVRLTADVVEGAIVAPGDDIRFRLTWDPAQWSGDDLERALTCVRVKGWLDPNLSAEEAPAANDGLVEYTLRVPDNIRPDCDVCAEGFLAGRAAGGGPSQMRSERICFMSGPRPPATTPPPAPPATTPPPAPPATTKPPAPPATAPPAPVAAPTTTTSRAPAQAPMEVGGVNAGLEGAPGVALGPAAGPTAELPRTGTAGRAGAAGGGLALALGGLAVIGGAGRARRRAGVV